MDNWEQYAEKAFAAERSGDVDGDDEAELTDIAIKPKADIVFKPDENGYPLWPDIDIDSIKLPLLKDTIRAYLTAHYSELSIIYHCSSHICCRVSKSERQGIGPMGCDRPRPRQIRALCVPSGWVFARRSVKANKYHGAGSRPPLGG